jgi:hypothetical protein
MHTAGVLSTASSGPQAGWTIISGPSYPHEINQPSPQLAYQPASPFAPSTWPVQHQKIPSTSSPTDMLSIDGGVDRLSLTRERGYNSRYSPYPNPSVPDNKSFTSSLSSPVGNSRNSFYDTSGSGGPCRISIQEEHIKLPPVHPPTTTLRASGHAPVSLPPISSLAAPSQSTDSRTVLQRLRASDAADMPNSLPALEEQLHCHRRSSSMPSNAQ